VEEHQVRQLFERFFADLTPEQEYEARHPDYVMEMPQSGERIRTREAMRAFQEAYPNPPLSACAGSSVQATSGLSRPGRTTGAASTMWWTSSNSRTAGFARRRGTTQSRSRRRRGEPSGSNGSMNGRRSRSGTWRRARTSPSGDGVQTSTCAALPGANARPDDASWLRSPLSERMGRFLAG
jgi:hypothetical protein